MYYIYLDESDKIGTYYSNFYGGIIMSSKHHDRVIKRLFSLIEELGLADEEVKWQKVNGYTYEKYIRIVDELFDILTEGKARIRIFFIRNNDKGLLLNEDNTHIYTKLYYQFIKNGFGLMYAPQTKRNHVTLIFDELPIGDRQRKEFKEILVGLSSLDNFKRRGINIKNIKEVNSKKHLPLQVLDLVLGAICFRLNDKQKEKNPDTGKRGVRTKLKEKLYLYIWRRICLLLNRDFKTGVSTGIKNQTERWTLPYSHWSFKPYNI